ncbi:MAG: glutaminase, partial [Maricaulaceae bacterium]
MDHFATRADGGADPHRVDPGDGDRVFQPHDDVMTDVFNALDVRVAGALTKHDICNALRARGILETDDRVAETVAALRELSDGDAITPERFVDLVRPNAALIERVAKGNLIIPDFETFAKDIGEIFDACVPLTGGAVADYIPQLARVDPEQFGLAICTIDGQRAFYGDYTASYCVQSSCKPINYCMALELNGEDSVHKHVGREPSGRSFNDLALNDADLPHNPLINAGAIMCCSLIKPALPIADRFDYVMQTWRRLSGNRRIGYNNSVYLSEKTTADRNFALAYFMQEKKAFPENTNLLETLDFYFQCCSLESSVRQMSIVAATLANSGVCPLTEERVFSADTVKH